MCKSLRCKDCPICGSNEICRILSPENIGEVVPIVEKWSKEHPQKTRLDDLKEKYANANLNAHGFPDFVLYRGSVRNDNQVRNRGRNVYRR